ncbi:MAG TPA: RDD family protein [Pirellulales bacterium]
MSSGFDPYLEWFGIAVDQRPPTHYQMLNLPAFESNPQTIESQAQLVLGFLQQQTSGPNSREAQQLIARIQQARVDLLDPNRKAAYDNALRNPGSVGPVQAKADPWATPSNPYASAGAGGVSVSSGDNPYAAPQNYGYQPEARSARRLASRWYRLGAQLVEMLILLVVLMAAGIVGAALTVNQDRDARVAVVLLIFAACSIPYAIVTIYMLSTLGQTIGKYVVGIRIVNADDGRNPGFVKAFLMRGLVPGLIGGIPVVGAIFGIADPLFIFGDEKRCLHDYIAGTVVVDA